MSAVNLDRRRMVKKLAGVALLILGPLIFFGLRNLRNSVSSKSFPPFPPPVWTLSGHGGVWIGGLGAFSPDGKMLVTGNADKTVTLWDVQTGKVLRTLSGRCQSTPSAVFSPNGKALMLSGLITSSPHDPGKYGPENDWGWLKLVDARTGALQWASKSRGLQNSIFHPNGKMLAINKISQGVVELRNAQTGGLLRTIKGSGDPREPIAFSPNGTMIAVAAQEPMKLGLWNPRTAKMLRTVELPWVPRVNGQMGGPPQYAYALAFSPDRRTIIIGTGDSLPQQTSGALRLYDVHTGALLRTLNERDEPTMSVVFSPDGKKMATATSAGTLSLWDTRTWKVQQMDKGEPYSVTGLTFSPDSKLLAGNVGKTVKLWKVN